MEGTISTQALLMIIGIGIVLMGIGLFLYKQSSGGKDYVIEVTDDTHPLVGRDIQINSGKKEFGVITRAFLQSEHQMIMVDGEGEPYPDDTVIFWAVFPAQNGEKHGCSRGLNRKNFDLM